MKKLKLDLDALAVESFSASERIDTQAGTVRGYMSARICPQYPDPSNDTGTIQTGPFLCSSSI